MLTGAQQALADFLRLDGDLLAIAAQTSPPLDEIADDPGQLATWVANLPHAQKNRLLLRVVEDHAMTVRMEMLRRFRDEHPRTSPTHPAGPWPISSTAQHSGEPTVSAGKPPSALRGKPATRRHVPSLANNG
jgi:hypothetical protein